MSDNRTDLPGPNAPNFNQRVRETLMVFLGRQGNPLDRGLTLRDLLENGLVKIKSGFSLKPGSSGSIPLEPVAGLVDVYEPDLTPPPTPTGLVATAAISHVMIEHAAPLYTQGHGHLRTRLYGKIVNTGDPLPTFSDAVEIGQFSGTVYAHPSNPATTWHLWVKWETNDGVLSVDPAGGTNGLVVTTGQDVDQLLTALTGQITESELYQTLQSRINLVDGPDTLSGSVAARIKTEETARTSADSALSSQITTLASTVYSNNSTLNAAIQSEATTRANADAAEATARQTLQSTVESNNITLTAAIQTEASTRATETGGLFAKYTVKVDLAGHVSGYGLASTSNGANPLSQFGVRANQFFVAPPAVSQATAPTTDLYKGYVWVDTSVTPNVTKYYTGSSWSTTPQALPFVIQTSATTINGKSVPAGVYIDDAYIKNGTITNAKIGDAAIDNAKIANLSASKLTSGTIAVGQWIASANYISGAQGWAIWGNGNAEFSAASIRGQLTASQIDTRGLSIKDESGNVILSAGTTLDWSKVGGANKPADGATVGATFGVNISGKMSDASVYINSLAVGRLLVQTFTATSTGSASMTNGATSDITVNHYTGRAVLPFVAWDSPPSAIHSIVFTYADSNSFRFRMYAQSGSTGYSGTVNYAYGYF